MMSRPGSKFLCELPPGQDWLLERRADGIVAVGSVTGEELAISLEPQEGYRLIDGVPHFNGIPLKASEP